MEIIQQFLLAFRACSTRFMSRWNHKLFGINGSAFDLCIYIVIVFPLNRYNITLHPIAKMKFSLIFVPLFIAICLIPVRQNRLRNQQISLPNHFHLHSFNRLMLHANFHHHAKMVLLANYWVVRCKT